MMGILEVDSYKINKSVLSFEMPGQMFTTCSLKLKALGRTDNHGTLPFFLRHHKSTGLDLRGL